MEEDPSYVPDHLGHAAEGHETAEDPGLVAVCEEEVYDRGGREEGAEEGIGSQVRVVAIYCPFNGTLGRDRSAVLGGGVVVCEWVGR